MVCGFAVLRAPAHFEKTVYGADVLGGHLNVVGFVWHGVNQMGLCCRDGDFARQAVGGLLSRKAARVKCELSTRHVVFRFRQ